MERLCFYRQQCGGHTVYITDTGCSADGRFFGADEEQAAGFEHLGALVFRRSVPAGHLISAFETSDRWTWVFSGRIATTAPEGFSLPQLGNYDQLNLFQSDGPNPLFRPRNFVFVLDDTGEFEEPYDVQTGNIPPDLIEGETALTFNPHIPPNVLHFDFGRFPEWMLARPQWMNRFAGFKNWVQ